MYDETFYTNVGINKVPVFKSDGSNSNAEILGYGYDALIDNGWQSHNINSNYRLNDKYQYICLDSNSDIKQKFTEEKIWKTQTKG
jgi:hypothetical protein